MRSRLLVTVMVVFLVAGAMNVAAFDVRITAPTVVFKGALLGEDAAPINAALVDAAGDFELQLTDATDDDSLARFSKQKDLARGFANAGATASHLGTQRTFIDYRRFAFVVGGGAAVVAPDFSEVDAIVDNIEEDGDIYIGAAIQPLNASLGLNLSRFVDGLRANVKVGYFSVDGGDELSFESLSIGVGASYQLLQPRSLPLGLIRWRGLSVASGLNFQRNTTEINLELDTIEAAELTFDDASFDATQLTAVGVAGEDPFGNLTITPELETTIESITYTIPLEVNTGIRFLYILELNAGAGVDLVFGSSELKIATTSEVGFDASPQAADIVDVQTGEGVIRTKTTNDPQLLRPRITAGIGANLGPVKLDVPLMYYFDSDGPGAMVGVNVGIVW